MKRIGSAIALAGLLAGCATPDRRSQGGVVDDTEIVSPATAGTESPAAIDSLDRRSTPGFTGGDADGVQGQSTPVGQPGPR